MEFVKHFAVQLYGLHTTFYEPSKNHKLYYSFKDHVLGRLEYVALYGSV